MLGKSRDYYYKIISRSLKAEKLEERILPLIKEKKAILKKEGAKKLYNRLKPELESLGIKMGRDKFLNLLKVNDLLQKRVRYKKPKTDSDHPFRKHKNLLKGRKVERPDEVYVSDITYIRVGGEWNYLTLVMDLFSRKIMGYNLSEGMKVSQTTEPALKMALKKRRTKEQTILHSDRGFQYCNPNFVASNLKNNIIPSMTNNGDPYENAASERLNGILKYEFDLKDEFRTYEIGKREVDKAVHLYNTYRTHWSLNLKTPDFIYNNPGLFEGKIVPCY